MYHGFQKNIKQQKQFSTLIIRTIINNWALSQHVKIDLIRENTYFKNI